MKKFWKILIVASMISLTGCQTVKDLIPTLVQRNPLVVPIAAPVEQYPYDWYVITAENSQAKFMELSGKGTVEVIGVSPDGFKNLNLSMAELRKYIQEQQAIIDAYRSYYEMTDDAAASTKKAN